MQAGTLFDAADGRPVVQHVQRTTNAWDRLRGLLARPALVADAALWLIPCNSVHTCFMGYAIDTVFLDRELRVLAVVPSLRPWRACGRLRAHSTLELAADGAARCGLILGQQLHWQPVVNS